MTGSNNKLRIRRALAEDADTIMHLFYDTISFVNATDYTPDQVEAWRAGALNKEKWLTKINAQYFLIAFWDLEAAGFASITHEGYIDFLFVHKNHLRKGVATQLFDKLVAFARMHGINKITSDVSITARPFFERQRFVIKKQQQVSIGNVLLTNFQMDRSLV